MKKKIDGVLIVEGTSDVAYLSGFLDALFFVTNGCDINNEKLDFLSRANKVNNLIVFTDPDKAGEGIRNSIKNKIDGVFEAKIEKTARKNYKKTGVAEADKNSVLSALEKYISDKEIYREKYDLSNLISLAENPSKKREEIVNKFGLIMGNNKSLENQLRILKISKEELWK